ncbi:MAG: hypothetical protein V4587_08310, partial [Acidobacteriota bacterium]
MSEMTASAASTTTPRLPLAATAPTPTFQMTDAEIQHLAPTRGDRLFLVLSIFIGILSGLLVV